MYEFINGSIITESNSLRTIIICTLFALLLGFFISLSYMYKNKYSRSMAVTLVILPAIVQVIIMLTSGNIGVGIAIAGTFSLVRFRSIPGTAREISALFFAMAIGFVIGLGYIFYAFVFLFIIGGAFFVLTSFSFGESGNIRTLIIRLPENLDYDGLFDDVFSKYAKSCELVKVRTINMGSLFELTYAISLKSKTLPKAFIDELRCRNGNLSVTLGRMVEGEEL